MNYLRSKFDGVSRGQLTRCIWSLIGCAVVCILASAFVSHTVSVGTFEVSLYTKVTSIALGAVGWLAAAFALLLAIALLSSWCDD